MKRLIAVIAAGLLLGGCAAAPVEQPQPPALKVQQEALPGVDKQELTVGERERSYVRSIPEGYDPSDSEESWPVVMAFHGMGLTSEDIRKTTGLEQSRAIVVFPQGVDNAWEPAPYAATNPGKDLAFVRAILQDLEEELRVDSSQIFATGFSNGGGFATYLGCQMPDMIAGVASVGGAFYHSVLEECSPAPVKYLNIHGSEDALINYNGGFRNGQPYSSVPDVLADLTARSGCEDQRELPSEGFASEFIWRGCVEPVHHLRINGGQHEWPAIATKEVRSFFGV